MHFPRGGRKRKETIIPLLDKEYRHTNCSIIKDYNNKGAALIVIDTHKDYIHIIRTPVIRALQ